MIGIRKIDSAITLTCLFNAFVSIFRHKTVRVSDGVLRVYIQTRRPEGHLID